MFYWMGTPEGGPKVNVMVVDVQSKTAYKTKGRVEMGENPSLA